MSRKELAPINAGSMADIAFLLLIFFLVTTTMDVETGILRILPGTEEETVEPKPINENKVLTIRINDGDEILLEGEIASIEEVRREVKIFMQNGGVFEDRPADAQHIARRWVDRDDLEESLGGISPRETDSPNAWRKKKKEQTLDAIALFGPYREMDKSAVILLEHSRGASYEHYLTVQNEIDAGLNELRDELASRYTEKTYLELDSRLAEERRLIKAIRSIYPSRLSEVER